MKLSVYLSNMIIEELKLYGDVDKVINRIVDTVVEKGYIDEIEFPSYGNRSNDTRLTVDIDNAEYEVLLETLGHNSKMYSLRRIIYWFIHNDKPSEFGWTVIPNPKYNAYIDMSIKSAKAANKIYESEILKDVINKLTELKR